LRQGSTTLNVRSLRTGVAWALDPAGDEARLATWDLRRVNR
jgi:hypothetical protein